jgi:uncharacterized protein (TIGR00251 family)
MKIEVKVNPKAKFNKVVQEHNGYHVYTTAPPDKNKANQAVIKLLSGKLNIPKSKIIIVRGKKSRNKIIQISP